MVASLCTLQDVRDEGLLQADASDSRVRKLIPLQSADLARWTRQRFEAVRFTDDAPLLVSGTGANQLFLTLPIVVLTNVVEMGAQVLVSNLTIYNRTVPDDRFNPKLAKTPASWLTGSMGLGAYSFGDDSGYNAGYPRRGPIWVRQRQSVALSGVFGFLDPDNAWVDCAAAGAQHIDSQVQLALAGYLGCLDSLATAADGGVKAVSITQAPIANGGQLGSGGTAYTAHFLPGTSLISDFETAIVGAGLQLKKASATPATALAAGDVLGPAWFACSPPADVRQCCVDLVIRNARLRADPLSAIDRRHARVASETTDGHTYQLQGMIADSGPTGDPDIDQVIARYKRQFISDTGGQG